MSNCCSLLPFFTNQPSNQHCVHPFITRMCTALSSIPRIEPSTYETGHREREQQNNGRSMEYTSASTTTSEFNNHFRNKNVEPKLHITFAAFWLKKKIASVLLLRRIFVRQFQTLNALCRAGTHTTAALISNEEYKNEWRNKNVKFWR